jgi:PAS domain S-box-containing protein
MNFFRNLPIKRKLTIVTVLISAVALALACAAFALYEQNLFRGQMERNFAVVADMFDDNVAAGLAFDDPGSIAKTLKAFDANQHIAAACVYDHKGAVVAEYRRAGLPASFQFPAAEHTGQRFTRERLETFRDIVLADEKIGVVYIGADLDELRERAWGYVAVVAALMVVCSLVALTLAAKLQKFISGPIVALAQTATAVAADRNYKVRAVKQSDDELGRLIDAFNHMLEQIENRDHALQQAHDELEHRVVERTSELAESVSLLNATLDSTTDGILAIDLNGRVASYNSKFVSMWSMPAALLQGREHRAFVEHAAAQMKNAEKFRAVASAAAARSEDWQTVSLLELADGRTFERYVHPQRVTGRTVGVVISFRDITERKRAEEKAAREQARFKRIFDAVPIGLTWMVRDDLDTRIVNAAHAEITGVPTEFCHEVDRYREITHPDDRGRQDALHRRLLAGEIERYELEKRYVHADGSVRWANLTVIFHRDPATGETQEINTLVDITERKRAGAELAETSALLEMMLQNSPDFIYFKDRQSRLVRFSRAFLPRFHCTHAELRGRSDFDLFSEEHARIAYEDEQEIMRSGRSIIGKLERETYEDGRMTWALTTKMPWCDASGAIVGTFGISKDVTELKETEAKLAYERDLLRVLLEASPDSIYFKDLDSRFVRVSRSETLRTLGRVAALRTGRLEADAAPEKPAPVEADVLIGLTDFDVYQGEDGRRAFEDEQAIIRTGEAMLGKVERMTVLDGSVRWNLTDKMPWRDGDGKIIGTFGVSKDITALKKAEEQLAEVHRQLLDTSRQAGMAEVATGVLHNVGNVLNSVNVSATLISDHLRQSKIGNVAKLRDLLRANEGNLAAFFTMDPRGRQLPAFLDALSSHLAGEQAELLKELDSLRKNIEHIKDIVAMQQSYAKVSGVTETVPLDDLVEDAVRMNAGALSRHDVHLVRDYQARPLVNTEKHKVLQILVNLIRNAKYACEESGRSDKRIEMRITERPGSVAISVIDNGVGIAPENLTRIFAHGFTTRKHGHGFGLHSGALAAKELGGSLTAASEGLGCGATFTLELPVKPAGAAA